MLADNRANDGISRVDIDREQREADLRYFFNYVLGMFALSDTGVRRGYPLTDLWLLVALSFFKLVDRLSRIGRFCGAWSRGNILWTFHANPVRMR